MDLASALTRAIPFAAKEGPLACVVVVPAIFDEESEIRFLEDLPIAAFPARVMASDGLVGICICLDPDADVPHVAMDPKALKKTLTAVRKLEFTLERTGDSTTTVRTQTGAAMGIPSFPVASVSISVPSMGKSDPLPTDVVAKIQQVMHAAAANKHSEDRPELANIHCSTAWVEATDQDRIARASVEVFAQAMLLPVALFQKWPKAVKWGSFFSLADKQLLIQVEEELRWAEAKSPDKFYDLSALLPAKDHGTVIRSLWIEPFVAALKQANASSSLGIVELGFSGGSVDVRGLDPEGTAVSSTVIRADGADRATSLVFNADHLLDAMKVLASTSCDLYYSSPNAPLRIESEGYVEVIWPQVEAVTEMSNGTQKSSS